ncbi:unnamed protein product [Lactuca virosa]|uniref:Secreted protein n=1 Tax=Lactuca virosa TaxID=75947 RepID=A0AAU9LWP6_9ASTR|nr:unnamed protein product [Lactuca virosa]
MSFIVCLPPLVVIAIQTVGRPQQSCRRRLQSLPTSIASSSQSKTPFTTDFLQPRLLLSSNISRLALLLPCRTIEPEDLLKIVSQFLFGVLRIE